MPLSFFTEIAKIGHVRILEIREIEKEIEGKKNRVTRLLGVNENSAKELKNFLKKYEFYLKRQDHRFLGPKLNLFSFPEETHAFGVTWHPKGLSLQRVLINWLEKQLPEEEQISTSTVVSQNFLELQPKKVKAFIFREHNYQLRSSFLYQHLQFWQHLSNENQELPWRTHECAHVFQKYLEAQEWGLFCQDAYLTQQTSICCLKEQVISELISSLHFIEQIITIFGFRAQWYLLLSRQKNVKDRKEREVIEWLKQALQAQPRLYPYSHELQELEEVGCCLELRVQDALNREWPVSRLRVIRPVQLNRHSLLLTQPKIEEDCVILIRQVWESLDRFIALLIEHYEGDFPFWLAPEQVRIIAIGEANRAYAQEVGRQLRNKGIRLKLDFRPAKLSLKIHEAEKEKVPYVALLGERERNQQTVSLRSAARSNQIQSLEIETFLNNIYQESLHSIPAGNRVK